jgi:hypothetical protein
MPDSARPGLQTAFPAIFQNHSSWRRFALWTAAGILIDTSALSSYTRTGKNGHCAAKRHPWVPARKRIMSLIEWISLFAVELLFWLWIVKWGGAERLEGTFASGFLISILAPSWSAEGIKLFAWLTMIAGSIWFVIGLFYPDIRVY